MTVSRMTAAVGGRMTLVFLPPKLLDALAEGGRVRSRCAYIGSDRDYEMEALEGVAEEPDPFHDWEGVAYSELSDRDDPHEDLLQRIGALDKKGKR